MSATSKKYRVGEPQPLRARLAELGAVFSAPVMQADAYFNHPSRDFAETDKPTTPVVVIVNEAMVDKFWPGQNPIGKRVKFLRGGFFEVIGVVKDVPHNGVEEKSGNPFIYQIMQGGRPGGLTLFVRTTRPSAP